MPYSTLDDMKKLLPEDAIIRLTDDEGAGSINQGRVDEAIAQADAEIDARIGGRYGVPLSETPAVIKKLSADIAVYNLYSRTLQSVPEVRAERYRNAVRMLEGISRGLVSLGVEPAPGAAESAAESKRAEGENVFSRETLEGF